MRFWRRGSSLAACAVLMAATLLHAQTSGSGTELSKKAATHKTSTKHKKSRKGSTSRTRGQKKIDPDRAREIQTALIREHYLDGKASGTWDRATEQAMQRYQADHGWQSKTTPDSRALIQLGLGPDHAHLLNPESAMTTPPEPAHSATQPTAPSEPK